MTVTDDEIKAYTQKAFSIDCHRMVLRQNTASPPRVYDGPGCIYQTPEGDLEFKIYDRGGPDISPLAHAFGPTALKAGEIIPAQEYFSIEATDLRGAIWFGDFIVLPKIIQGRPDHGPVITGELRTLAKTTANPHPHAPKPYLTLRFADALEFPGNTAASTTILLDNEVIESSRDFATAKFGAAGLNFTIRKDDSSVLLTAESPDAVLPDRLDVYICEALEFALFESVPWVVSGGYGDRTFKTELRPFPKQRAKGQPRPPINFRSHLTAADVWRLFAKYLEYIMNRAGPDGHPMSAAVRAAVEGNAGYLEPGLLALPVAVERLLNSEFPNLGRPNESTREQIESASKLIASSDLGASMKARLDLSLKAMLNARAQDKLMTLAADGLIRKELVRAWKSIRNPAAHGAGLDPAKIDRVYRDYQSAQTLFNELVFLTIGYTGKYTDYSVSGWPLRDFEKVRPAPHAPADGG